MSQPAGDPLWWFEHAACASMNRDLWFHPANQHVQAMAINLCNTCLAEDVCLCYGLSLETHGLRTGIFGGVTAAQREGLGIDQELAWSSYEVERELLWKRVHG